MESSSGETENNYRFTGEQFDESLDEYYLRARYYNPGLGRFTSRDLFEGMMAQPLSLAKYPYVHNNSVNAIDPTGMFLQDYSATGQATARRLEADLQVTQLEKVVSVVGFVARVAVQAAEVVARAYMYSQEIPSQVVRFLGVPAIVWGGDLFETTIHTLKAQTGSGHTFNNEMGELFGSQPLPLLLSRAPSGTHPRDRWYRNLCPCC